MLYRKSILKQDLMIDVFELFMVSFLDLYVIKNCAT